MARHDGLVVFVTGALPGERVRARMRRRSKGFAEADLLAILRPSPDRASPPCEHYGECGGCDLQHLSPAGQARAKQEQVRALLTRIAGIRDPPIGEIVTAATPWGYRSRVDFDWSGIGEKPVLGLHRRGRPDSIVPIRRCHLVSERANRLAAVLAQRAGRLRLTAWDRRRRTGFLRRASIQEGSGTGDLLLTLETGRGEPPAIHELASQLRGESPHLVGIVRREVDRAGDLVEESILAGRDHLHTIIDGDRFQVPAGVFFQTNFALSGRLRSLAMEALALNEGDAVLEFFCGVGFMTRALLGKGREVAAAEGSRDALSAARVNLAAAGSGSVRLVGGDIAELWPALLREKSWSAVLVDPPRTGLPRGMAEGIAAARIGRLVYVSCDPSTLARDLAMLLAGGWFRLASVRPVEMFPQTRHIECVAALHGPR